MIDIPKTELEKAILIGVNTRSTTKEIVEEHLEELELLSSTAGANAVFKIIQDRNSIDPAYFIGKGKAEEIAELVELNDINLVIFDDDLNPTQIRNLEKLINKKILDRSGLILDIFASHAKTNASKTQVELAQLQYMMGRLTRAWTHLSKQYAGVGTKGPGETQIETDRRLIRTRIGKLKQKLAKIESQTETKSMKRKDFLAATLVGYTNAGKSTLLNLLTEADVLAEDKLFATLDSTTRSLELAKNKSILMSDTVGFIRKLPHHLVASFKSTLSVVGNADIILHIIDASHPFYEDHINVVEETLKELKCESKIELKIFNKIDAIKNNEQIEYIRNKYKKSIMISAMRGINITNLRKMLLEIFEKNFSETSIELSVNNTKIISQIHELADVTGINYNDQTVEIKFRANPANTNKIKRLIDETSN
ncbi:GTPase HflX [Bacteroidota bacterium]